MAATTMLAVTAPSYCDPSQYEVSTVPRPVITEPTDVLIKVHAASVNPVDVKKADGVFKAIIGEEFPYQIGYDAAGVVEAIGKDVKKFVVGDEVFVRLPEINRGAWSEYAKSSETFFAKKPSNISLSDAASLPLAAMTGLQALRHYKGSLEGKTVFIPAGLSGTGAYACQLAKNVFGAGKVITTVSTAKVAKVPELLGEGVVDQIIDYTKQDPATVIPPGSVDFMLDTTGQAMQFLSLMVPQTSFTVSISTMPSSATILASDLMERPDNPRLPLLGRLFLDAGDGLRRLRAWRWGVAYQYMLLDPNGRDLDAVRQIVEEGKVVPVVGARIKLRDVERVREACGLVYKAKGGLGKTVIEVA